MGVNKLLAKQLHHGVRSSVKSTFQIFTEVDQIQTGYLLLSQCGGQNRAQASFLGLRIEESLRFLSFN